MAHLTYFAVLAACLIGTSPLEFVLHVGVYRQWRRLLAAIAPGFVLFTLWDGIAIHVEQWGFNSRFVTGWRAFGIPVEEICFFLVIPVCAVLTIEAVRARKPQWFTQRTPAAEDAPQ